MCKIPLWFQHFNTSSFRRIFFSPFQPANSCQHLFSTSLEQSASGERGGKGGGYEYEKNNLRRIAVIHNRHRAIFCWLNWKLAESAIIATSSHTHIHTSRPFKWQEKFRRTTTTMRCVYVCARIWNGRSFIIVQFCRLLCCIISISQRFSTFPFWVYGQWYGSKEKAKISRE